MDEKIKTNILFIGKSGVGKSSLLNYIFGENIQKTGVGHPVTTEYFTYRDYETKNLLLTVCDTMGLEADKAHEWKTSLIEEVQKHDKMEVNDWFSTIFYCFSKNQARVENFEIGIIENLIRAGNRCIIVITHCDSKDDEAALVMENTVIKELEDHGFNTETINVLKINSVAVKTLGGKSVEQFGKNTLLKAVIQNLWRTFKIKVPQSAYEILNEEISKAKGKLIAEINKRTGLFSKSKDIDEIEKLANETSKEHLETISTKISLRFNNAASYFNALTQRYFRISEFDTENIINDPNFLYDVRTGLEADVKEIVQALNEKIDELNWLISSENNTKLAELKDGVKNLVNTVREIFISKKRLKEIMTDETNAFYGKVEILAKKEIDRISKELNELKIEERYMEYFSNIE